MIGRRGFITGLISLVAAPAIVRAGSLMPIKAMPVGGITEYWDGRVRRFTLPDGEVYGRSPAMDSIAELRGHYMLYGSGVVPVLFTGFHTFDGAAGPLGGRRDVIDPG